MYTYGWRPDETELCRMEMRAFFSEDTEENVLISDVKVQPSRSHHFKMIKNHLSGGLLTNFIVISQNTCYSFTQNYLT